VEKFINISTDEVYGELKEDGQFYEVTPLNPNSPYSVSKASADMLGRAYYRTYGMPVITVRPSNNYGSWQYPEKLIPVVILKALNNEKIPVYGKGDNVREWLFVSDCVTAVFSVLKEGNAGEIYNIGSGEEKKNIEVVKTILRLLEKSEDLIEFTKDRLGHDFRYSLNSEKIREQLGWEKEISFDEGIENTVKWYVDNMTWVKAKLVHLNKYWEIVYKS
jgi:dTDP-glucose 4,6-dehydratase